MALILLARYHLIPLEYFDIAVAAAADVDVGGFVEGIDDSVESFAIQSVGLIAGLAAFDCLVNSKIAVQTCDPARLGLTNQTTRKGC